MHDAVTIVATITAHSGSREKVLQALKTVERDVGANRAASCINCI
ncbi:hypothetical protein [Citrobacter freundii]|nr:hypothetical protein [Citrobacter freundii]